MTESFKIPAGTWAVAACLPSDETVRAALGFMMGAPPPHYTGEVVGKCDRCGTGICIGPKIQALIEKGIALPHCLICTHILIGPGAKCVNLKNTDIERETS